MLGERINLIGEILLYGLSIGQVAPRRIDASKKSFFHCLKNNL